MNEWRNQGLEFSQHPEEMDAEDTLRDGITFDGNDTDESSLETDFLELMREDEGKQEDPAHMLQQCTEMLDRNILFTENLLNQASDSSITLNTQQWENKLPTQLHDLIGEAAQIMTRLQKFQKDQKHATLHPVLEKISDLLHSQSRVFEDLSSLSPEERRGFRNQIVRLDTHARMIFEQITKAFDQLESI